MKAERVLKLILVIITLAVCHDGDGIASLLTPRSVLAASYPEEVVLFSTSWCGYCRKAREYLNSNGIAHVEYDIEKSSEGKRQFAELGGRGVPLILVGNQEIRGWNPAALKAALARARIISPAPAPPARGGANNAASPPPIDYGDLEMSYISIITPPTDSEHRYTIHLRDERTISVKEYWEDGDQIMYEKFGGIVGVERKDVVKIDDTADGTTKEYK